MMSNIAKKMLGFSWNIDLPTLLLELLLISEFFWYPRFALLGANLRVVDLIAIFTLVWYLTQVFLSGESVFSIFKSEPCFLLLLVFVVLSSLFSSAFSLYPGISFRKTLAVIENCWLAYFAMRYYSVEKYEAIKLAVVSVCLFQILFAAITQYGLNIGDIMMGSTVRVSGLSFAYFATHLLIVLVFALPVYILAERGSLSGFFFSGFLLISIILTQIRTIWILVATLIIMALILSYIRRRTRRLAWLTVFWVVAPLFLMMSSRVSHQLGSNTGGASWGSTLESRGYATADIRFELWRAANRIWHEHPVFGTGPGSFGELYLLPKYADRQLLLFSAQYSLGKSIDAHSAFFTRIAETGTVGEIIYFALAIFLLYRAKRLCAGNKCVPLTVAFMLFVTISFFADLISDPLGMKLYWITSGILIKVSENV